MENIEAQVHEYVAGKMAAGRWRKRGLGRQDTGYMGYAGRQRYDATRFKIESLNSVQKEYTDYVSWRQRLTNPYSGSRPLSHSSTVVGQKGRAARAALSQMFGMT